MNSAPQVEAYANIIEADAYIYTHMLSRWRALSSLTLIHISTLDYLLPLNTSSFYNMYGLSNLSLLAALSILVPSSTAEVTGGLVPLVKVPPPTTVQMSTAFTTPSASPRPEFKSGETFYVDVKGYVKRDCGGALLFSKTFRLHPALWECENISTEAEAILMTSIEGKKLPPYVAVFPVLLNYSQKRYADECCRACALRAYTKPGCNGDVIDVYPNPETCLLSNPPSVKSFSSYSVVCPYEK